MQFPFYLVILSKRSEREDPLRQRSNNPLNNAKRRTGFADPYAELRFRKGFKRLAVLSVAKGGRYRPIAAVRIAPFNFLRIIFGAEFD